MNNNFNNFKANQSTITFNDNLIKPIEELISNDNKNIDHKLIYVLCGNSQFCFDDLLELNKNNIPNKVFNVINKEDLSSFFNILSLQNINLKYLHISAHANETGILFNKTFISKNNFKKYFTKLPKLKFLFLSNCKSIELAKELLDTSELIVSSIDDLDNEHAKKLANLIWFLYLNLNLDIDKIDKLIYYLYPDIYKNILILKQI